MTEGERDSDRDRDLDQELERLTRLNEFWYLAMRAAVAVVVRSAGTDAAQELIDAIADDADGDFPLNTSDARVSEPVASYLLEDLRRRAQVWEEHGSIEKAGRRG